VGQGLCCGSHSQCNHRFLTPHVLHNWKKFIEISPLIFQFSCLHTPTRRPPHTHTHTERERERERERLCSILQCLLGEWGEGAGGVTRTVFTITDEQCNKFRTTMYRLVAESHGDRCRPNPLTLLNGRGQGAGRAASCYCYWRLLLEVMDEERRRQQWNPLAWSHVRCGVKINWSVPLSIWLAVWSSRPHLWRKQTKTKAKRTNNTKPKSTNRRRICTTFNDLSSIG